MAAGNDYVIVGREDILTAPFETAQVRTLTTNSRNAQDHLMENNRNFFITIALSVVILTLWQVFYMNPRIEAQTGNSHDRSPAARGRKESGTQRED